MKLVEALPPPGSADPNGTRLHIAEAIVEARGGSVEVASRPDEGTTLPGALTL